MTVNRLNVGCGRNILPGWTNLDIAPLPGVDVVADLEKCGEQRLPFRDSFFDEILLSHVLEHIRNLLPLVEELHRVAKPGAIATVRVPHGASDVAYEDPTHVRRFFASSFLYFGQPLYWRADYGYRGDWEARKITSIINRQENMGMSAQEILTRIYLLRNIAKEMVVEMIAIKPIRPAVKELQVAPKMEVIDEEGVPVSSPR
jgi:SAM-dependent methyltransferase